MTLRIVRGRTYPIGVDLGSTSVKMAQLVDQENGLTLIASQAVGVDVPETDNGTDRLQAQGRAIRRMMRGKTFRGNRSILSMPAGQTVVQHVKLPRMTAEDVPAALGEELNGKLPYPVAEAIIRHVVVGESGNGSDTRLEVMTVSANRRQIEDYLTMARKARLDVVGIDIEACAVAECFSRLFRRAADQARTVVFLDIGAAVTQVVLMQGQNLRFARNLPVGTNDLDTAVAAALHVSDQEAHTLRTSAAEQGPESQAANEVYALLEGPLERMTAEVNQCLRYCESVFHNQGLERAVFVGGGAHDKRFCQSLAQRLNLPGQIGDPMIRVRREGRPHTGNDPEPNWAVAVGLSLGAYLN